MAQMYIRHLLPLAALAMLAACVQNGNPGERVHVITQVCLPGMSANSDETVWFESVTRTSYDTKAENLLQGSTTQNQPVYETHAQPPSEIVALVIFLQSDREKRYVYIPPKKIGVDDWTDWSSANFYSTDPRIKTLLMRGQPMTQSTPDPESPKIRYRLMRFNDYLKRVEERRVKGGQTKLSSC